MFMTILANYSSEYTEESHYLNVKHWYWQINCWYLCRQTVERVQCDCFTFLLYKYTVFCCVTTEFHILLYWEIQILTEFQPNVSHKFAENWKSWQNPANPNISHIFWFSRISVRISEFEPTPYCSSVSPPSECEWSATVVWNDVTV